MLDNLTNFIDEFGKHKADYCDLYLQSSAAHSVRYEDMKFSEFSSVVTEGCGARIISRGKSFYAHRPGVSLDSVSSSFGSALEAACIGSSVNFCGKEKLFEANSSLKRAEVDFFHDIDSNLRSRSDKIKQVSIAMAQTDKNVLIIVPHGLVKQGKRSYTTFMVQIVAEKNGQLQTASERKYLAVDIDGFLNKTDFMQLADTAFERAMLMLDAKPCPAGVMNVYLAGEAGGTIIHEACGHGLEADIIEKDASVFKGKIGSRVACDLVTMVDDPTMSDLYGSYTFDDEGTDAKRTVLIEDGILKGYMTDRLTSMLYGYPMTGNGRRQSYKKIPIPRMSNTFLLPKGAKSEQEMLELAGDGLYVKKMGGGEVNPTTGDFVFYVSEAYIIKGGKKAQAVKGATLTGNGPEVLQNIIALGDNLVMDAGVCGKSGQSVPVTDGQPSMLIKNMTVGGSIA